MVRSYKVPPLGRVEAPAEVGSGLAGEESSECRDSSDTLQPPVPATMNFRPQRISLLCLSGSGSTPCQGPGGGLVLAINQHNLVVKLSMV